jgi:hypothetical protein
MPSILFYIMLLQVRVYGFSFQKAVHYMTKEGVEKEKMQAAAPGFTVLKHRIAPTPSIIDNYSKG